MELNGSDSSFKSMVIGPREGYSQNPALKLQQEQEVADNIPPSPCGNDFAESLGQIFLPDTKQKVNDKL